MPTNVSKKVSFKIKKESTADYLKDNLKEQDVDTFDRDDCDERDYNDDGGLSRRRKKNAKLEESAGGRVRTNKIVSTDFLPNSMKQLRACVHCKIVLNTAKWKQLGKCPNCPSSGGLCETTKDFQNLIGQIYPKMSWVS